MAIGGRGQGLLIFAGLLSGAAACSSVDLGDPPADVNACRPSQTFFASDIGPKFLFQTYPPDNKSCGDATCHGAGSNRFFYAEVPKPDLTMPVLTIPFVPGSDWDRVYRSAIQQMNCSNVLGSELYTRPAGLRNHAPGKLIEPGGPEELLLQMWVTQAGP